jgi:hypothetical protein
MGNGQKRHGGMMDKWTKDALRRVDKERDFPSNTCAASRHAQMIGEYLARKKPYAMLTEEPDHCGGSILSTVASLYEARSRVRRLKEAMDSILALDAKRDLPDAWNIASKALKREQR